MASASSHRFAQGRQGLSRIDFGIQQSRIVDLAVGLATRGVFPFRTRRPLRMGSWERMVLTCPYNGPPSKMLDWVL